MSKELNFLVVQSKKVNTKAQLKLYDLHCDAMFTISYRYVKDIEIAKDLMQDGFLKAFLNLKNLPEKSNFSAWLKKLIINTCIDYLKKKKLETVSLENYPLAISDDDDDWNFNRTISKKSIEDAVEKLPVNYQIVVKLFLMEGYDHQEISEILEIPVSTSKTHLRRGKLLLRETLKKKNYET